jgi:hypothetical protein
MSIESILVFLVVAALTYYVVRMLHLTGSPAS